VTPYTDLSPKWLDSLAFALLHYRASGDLIAEHGLTSALHTATGTLGVPLETGMADVALAIGGRLEGAVPAGSAGLEFRDLETGETVDPEIFTTTVDGQASVWAARVAAAAMAGDRSMVESLVDHQLGLGAMPFGLGFRQLLLGASMIAQEAAHREQAVAYRAFELTGNPPEYTIACSGSGPFGGASAGICVRTIYGARDLRDARAARHVLETNHALTLKEE
jgi:hypothetical protein